MFVDRDELIYLFDRKYDIVCLLEKDNIPEYNREILRGELADIEDDIKIIEMNCLKVR